MDLPELLTDPILAEQARRVRLDPDLPFPLLLVKIKLIWTCNLRCGVCALWKTGRVQNPLDPPLKPELVEKVLVELAGNGLQKVHLSGGEVFLRPDVEEIIQAARDLDLQVNLTTNGTLIDKEQARMLVRQRVHTAAFSIDDCTEKKHDQARGVEGAWRMTWKGIARLQARKEAKGRGPVVAVNTVITRNNIDRLSELHRLLAEKKVDSWRLLPVRTPLKKLRPRPEQWTRMTETWDQWRPLFTRRLLDGSTPGLSKLASKGWYAGRAFDSHVCYAPWFSLFIDADGRVYPCCTGRRKMPAYGNVLKTPLSDILSSNARREILTNMASGHAFEICRSCDEFLEENQAFALAAQKEEKT